MMLSCCSFIIAKQITGQSSFYLLLKTRKVDFQKQVFWKTPSVLGNFFFYSVSWFLHNVQCPMLYVHLWQKVGGEVLAKNLKTINWPLARLGLTKEKWAPVGGRGGCPHLLDYYSLCRLTLGQCKRGNPPLVSVERTENELKIANLNLNMAGDCLTLFGILIFLSQNCKQTFKSKICWKKGKTLKDVDCNCKTRCFKITV